MMKAHRRETCRVTGLQHAGGRGCAVAILERVVRSFLEELTFEQRFEGARESHTDVPKKDSPIRRCSQSGGGGSRARRGSERRVAEDKYRALVSEGLLG